MWKVKRMNTARIVVPAIASDSGRPEPAMQPVRARQSGVRFAFGIPASMTAQT
jgi:hypothetical protein